MAIIRSHIPGCLLFVWLAAACLPAPNAWAGEALGTAYLFTSFRDADQKYLRYLYSYDGYHWTNVPGTFLAAAVGTNQQFRDPSIARGADGIYHLVWTAGWHGDQGFGCAQSADLIHWSAQHFIPVMTNEPTTVNVWAPEVFYDAPQKQFVIAWASTIPGRYPDDQERHDNNHRLYYTTTTDFTNFSPARLYFEPGFSVIDGFILADNGRYILLNKDNSRAGLNLRVAQGAAATGPWTHESAAITQKFTEGPCALKVGDDWLVFFDAYREKIYGALRTRDFVTFSNVTSAVSFPSGHKHGTAIPITTNQLAQILKAHPEP